MSATSKCPRCGEPLMWCESGWPVFAYCSDTEKCCYETEQKRSPEDEFAVAMHRIRELEARIVQLEAEKAAAELEAENLHYELTEGYP